MKISKAIQPSKTTTGEVSRRKFLVLTAAGAMCLAMAEAVRISLAFLKPPPTEGFGGVFECGSVEDFPLGSVNHVRQGRLYIVNVDAGLLAIFQRCTHLGCLVPWDEEKSNFACPCHAGHYNVVGEVISGPPPRPLDLFKLEIIEDQVIVDTSQALQRERYAPWQATEV